MERVAVRSVERGAIRVARGHEVELAAAEVPGAEEAEGEGEGACVDRVRTWIGEAVRGCVEVLAADRDAPARSLCEREVDRVEGLADDLDDAGGGGSPACSSGYIRTRRA